MSELVAANWWLLVIALVLGLAVAWWIFVGSRRTKVEIDRRDMLDEGGARARRNQALIDTPRSKGADEGDPIPPPTPEGLAGVGMAVQAEAAPAPAPHDDLTRIKGVGPKLAARLHHLGVTGFDDIASWSEADIDRIDSQLGQFQGRIRRDKWVEQARLLDAGDTAGFEGQFGKL